MLGGRDRTLTSASAFSRCFRSSHELARNPPEVIPTIRLDPRTLPNYAVRSTLPAGLRRISALLLLRDQMLAPLLASTAKVNDNLVAPAESALLGRLYAELRGTCLIILGLRSGFTISC